jgi:TolB-like protein
MRGASIALVLTAIQAWAQAPGPDAGVTASIAVLPFEGNKDGAEHASAVAALMAADLARAPEVKVLTQADVAGALAMERQRQLLGAACDENCLIELSGALGARYVLNGRVDAFGDRLVITATLFDARKSVALAKPRAEAAGVSDLPIAARAASEQILQSLGLELEVEPIGAIAGPSVGLKVGPKFFESLRSLNLEGSVEVGYRFQPTWVGYLQVGFTIVTSSLQTGSLTVIPTVLGARHLYRIDRDFQPYWGLALGVQLTFGQFGPIQNTQSLPTVLGLVGFQYLITHHLALGAECSSNLSEAALGIAQGVGSGLNLDFVGTVTWRF